MLKQLRILHKHGFSEAEVQRFRLVIQISTLEYLGGFLKHFQLAQDAELVLNYLEKVNKTEEVIRVGYLVLLMSPLEWKKSSIFFRMPPPPTGQWGARRSTGGYNARHDMFTP